MVEAVSSGGERSIGVGGEIRGISSTGDRSINVQYNTYFGAKRKRWLRYNRDHRRLRWLRPFIVPVLSASVLVAVFAEKPADSPSGPPPAQKPDPIFLSEIAHEATWTSGRGKVIFNGGQPGTRLGHAVPDVETLEDGSRAGGFLTHPNWAHDGYLRGCFKLPRQIRADDWFIADGGFPQEYSTVGNVRFQVFVRDRKGEKKKIVDELDDRANGRLTRLDVPLGLYAGSATICLQVTANGDPGQDRAFWIEPHIGPRRA